MNGKIQYFYSPFTALCYSNHFPKKSIGGAAFFIGNFTTAHFLKKFLAYVPLHVILVLMIPVLKSV
jgi:hypothetical protein